MKGLTGKNVLVTGGSSGIGQAIAIRFGEEGANVALNYYRSRDEAEHTEAMIEVARRRMQQMGVRDILVQADVSREEDVVRMFRTVLDEWGTLDILINNAGFQISGDSHDIDLQSFERVIATNLT